MGKDFTAKSADRIARSVRWTEGQVPQLQPGRPAGLAMPPIELCMFEMVGELILPQNGPGSQAAYKLVWNPEAPHGTLPINQYGEFIEARQGFPTGRIYHPENWLGDVTTIVRDYTQGPDTYGGTEMITCVDVLRQHSKMATVEPDVGAYGVAWKPQTDGPFITFPHLDPRGQVPVWFILTMQTPGSFWGLLKQDLTQLVQEVTVQAFDVGPCYYPGPWHWGYSQAGHRTLDGYDVFGVGHGDEITVFNPPADPPGGGYGPYWFRGVINETIVFCQWHMRHCRYYITAVAPKEQTVVTGVNFGAQTVTTKQVGVLWSV